MSAQKYANKSANSLTKEFNGTTFSGSKTLVENLAISNRFTYLTQVLSNEALLKEINQEEMVTVFVMTDKVFSTMNKEELAVFMASSTRLAMLLKSHSVPGRLDAVSIKKAIENNGGAASFLTLAGTKLTATIAGETITLKDVEGNQARVIAADFYHKNGFFHIIDGMAYATAVE